MKLFITSLILLLLLVPFIPKAEADTLVFETDQVMTVEAKALDPRAKVLKDYLTEKNSPMQYHAQDFIDAADEYGVDWKLVPAIAGVESNFGKYTPGGYNGWGWGVYGTNRIYFKNWRDGIYTVTSGLKQNYINKGLTNPYTMNRVYASSPTWGTKVSYFINDIDKYSANYDLAGLALERNAVQSVTSSRQSAKLAYTF